MCVCEKCFSDLDNDELIEILAILEGMDDSLKEQEELLKGNVVDDDE